MDETVTKIDAPCRECGGLLLSNWSPGRRGERIEVSGSERCATPERHQAE